MAEFKDSQALVGEQGAAMFYVEAYGQLERVAARIPEAFIRQLLVESIETTILNRAVAIQTGEAPFELTGEPAQKQIRAYINTSAQLRENSARTKAGAEVIGTVSLDAAIDAANPEGGSNHEQIASNTDVEDHVGGREELQLGLATLLGDSPVMKRLNQLGMLYESTLDRAAVATRDARLAQICHKVAGIEMKSLLVNLGHDGVALKNAQNTARNWPRVRGGISPSDFSEVLCEKRPEQGVVRDIEMVATWARRAGLSVLATDLASVVDRMEQS